MKIDFIEDGIKVIANAKQDGLSNTIQLSEVKKVLVRYKRGPLRLSASCWQDDVQVLFVAGCHGDRCRLGDGHRRGDEPRHRALREGAGRVQRWGKSTKYNITKFNLCR